MTDTRLPTLLVAIATYRRPDGLRRLLDAMPDQLDSVAEWCDAGIVVVDNDPQESARSVVGTRARYAPEATPGIAAARNRALAEAEHADLLVFIDDDEVPRPHWLRSLVGMWRDHRQEGVVGVAGPVYPRYLLTPPAWIREGPFHSSHDFVDGSDRDHAATGNLLLDLAFVRQHGLRFEALGTRGGEDTRFTFEMTRLGGRILWCARAVADENVPEERSTRTWVAMRSMGHGNVTGLKMLDDDPRLPHRLWIGAQALLRLGGGGLKLAVALVRRNPAEFGQGAHTALRGAGFGLSALDVAYDEYARDGRRWSFRRSRSVDQ